MIETRISNEAASVERVSIIKSERVESEKKRKVDKKGRERGRRGGGGKDTERGEVLSRCKQRRATIAFDPVGMSSAVRETRARPSWLR